MRKKRPTKKKTINNNDIPLSQKEKPKTELTEIEQFWVEQKCRDGASLDEVKSQNIQPVALVEQVYKKIKAEMIMQVHDELVFYIDEDKIESEAKKIISSMKNVKPFEDILEVNGDWGKYWSK